MPVTIAQINKLSEKYKNSLIIEIVQKNEDEKKVDAFIILYQRHGIGGRASQGLIDVNAVWDERKSRPKGYIVVHGSEIRNGESLSIMVSEEFYRAGAKNGVLDAKIAEWVSTYSRNTV
ncbi:hypothetical protein DFQ01_121103 [Paenibacillus cellulosilyticus]|uniref:Uncharacterized protein n=1 Tax=Paenibacillus cellulosilyticus TaxID=375489 RepID=A0A2V2YP88_9BACL|nr:hypothetical protein [Paenibacillus cellulosilyticus]PWV97459.1 hypothetical protein DFQ01_121103 [Paenibacillus cellulosilyticus]QKS48504.1 hypothetical protein HUB94_30175 [Paenibacillus cellulosilyticus]